MGSTGTEGRDVALDVHPGGLGGELMEFSEDVAPQLPPAAKIETGVEEGVAPEAEPELSAEQPEPGGEPQST